MRAAVLALTLACVVAQQPGTQKQEVHLPLTLSECTGTGCTGAATSVTLDGNWRWTRKEGGYQNCYTGTSWDQSACDTPEDCAKNCALEGVPTKDWHSNYGVTSDGSILKVGYKTGNNVGSRMYLLQNESHYRMFKLLNREFAFDVDDSNLPCGLNGAVYFAEMMADGGMSEFAGNKAGAKFGTGYCDAQCPHDIKFINGESNTLNWNTTAAMGKYGTCCAEMDIWEANSRSTAYTAHPCSLDGPKRCENEKDCGQSGFCDRPGCDLNTYRFGNKEFFGKGSNYSVDTTKSFTVVTQFITHDNTDTGDLVEIRRFYIQDGIKIETPKVDVGGTTHDSITADFCTAQKQATGDKDEFGIRGGLKQMGKALQRGMVLVMSLWDDGAAKMLWLDSVYPPGATGPGAERGPCDPSSGIPSDCRSKYPNAYVRYGNLKVGTLGSTTKFPPAPPPPGPIPGYPGTCHARDGSFDGPACGYACDENCNCGRCNSKPGCLSESQCTGPCNGGGNAKWCGVAPTPGPGPMPPSPPPPPPPASCHQKDGSFDGAACGYSCDDNCNCGRCNSKPGCMNESQCLGPCNGGSNAKWCGGAPTASQKLDVVV